MARIVRRTEVNECRQCATFCDRVIAPASCIADDCPNLYTYDDPLTGRREPAPARSLVGVAADTSRMVSLN